MLPSSNPTSPRNALDRALAWAAVERVEAPAVALSFVLFFCVLASYYVLRPVRDAMAVTAGPDGQKWMFTVVFLVMLAAVPLFGWIVSRYARRLVLPIVYVFFIANIFVFWLAIRGDATGPTIAGTFFVWVSVFVLFVVSLFWSFMADHYTRDQATRLYGPISAGGSIGALTGSSLTGALVHTIGIPGLLVLSALLLTGALACALVLAWTTPSAAAVTPVDETAGHGVLAGALHAWRDPFLFRIALWVLLANLVGTYFYVEEQRIVGAALTTKADQVAYFSSRDRIVGLLQIASQLLVTGFLLRKLGVGICAAALPVTACAGLVALAVSPQLTTIWLVMVAERAIAFGLSNPAARVLWTIVTPEDKYKTQSFIDTVVYRGGDAASVWAVNGLNRSFGLPLPAIAMLMLPLGAAWIALTFQLSRRLERATGKAAVP